MKPAITPLPIRSVAETSVRMLASDRQRRLHVAPLGMEEAVLAHQAHLGLGAAGAQLARRVDREQHCFRLALVRPEFFVSETNHPLVVVLNEKISRWRHRWLPIAPPTHGYATRQSGEH